MRTVVTYLAHRVVVGLVSVELLLNELSEFGIAFTFTVITGNENMSGQQKRSHIDQQTYNSLISIP